MSTTRSAAPVVGEGRSLLFVEDDEALRGRLAQALRRRGFEVTAVGTAAEARAEAARESPELALLDLRLPDEDGLALAASLHALDPRTLIVILTGYGSIPTALEAVRLGVTWFITKPADADDVLAAFARGDEGLRQALGLPEPESRSEVPPRPAPTLARLEWEHIQRVLADCGGNISHAAEALGLHRRTLQRKLAKRPNLR